MSDFKIKCVKVFGHVDTQQLLDEAFKCLKDQCLSPAWFREEECFSVNQKRKNEVYIFDVFTGDAFEHITSLGCRVLGPMCVVTCLACKQDIPRRLKPVYNLAMKDVIVCCTNIDREQRDLLHEKVEWMGGIVTKDFTDEVTHLVAGTVGSQKYQVAGSYGRQIMLPKWVDEVWKKSKLEAVHGNDEQFQEYKCPIFMGHVITVSGLNASERTEAKRLIEKEGGTYSGEMKARECTHLIINEPKGQKYNFAIKWEVHVVRSEWLYESIEKGYCQDEGKYPVDRAKGTKGGMKTSTPERRSIADGDLSDINNISMISVANVNETAFNNVTNMTTRLEDPTENLDLTKAPGDMFLDGCKIYLSGFRGATLEKLRKIINSGGGTRFNQITDNLTHVVIGERILNDIDMIKSLTNRPHTVSAQWLVECFNQERLVEETTYHTVEVIQPMPKTPEVKGVRKKSRRVEVDITVSKEVTKKDDEDMQDIMSQYLHNEQPKHTGLDVARSNETTVGAGDVDDDQTQDPDSSTVNVEGGVFAGRSFVFYGFTEDDIPVLSSYIKENGGTLLQGNARRIPDYAIVPIDGYPVDRTVKDIATNAWLQMCIEHNVLFDLTKNPLFTPIELNIENLPLDDCVVSISGYLGTERESLENIADALGGKTQDHFVRKAIHDMLPSTHLIVNAPEGSKYKAAKKWCLPAVSKLWLLACAKSGRKEQVDTFLIDNISDNATLQMLDKQSAEKQLDQSEHLLADNQSTKPIEIDQSESSKSRKNGLLNSENGANLNKTNEDIAQNYVNEPEYDLPVAPSKPQEAVRSNETSLPDFSTMGDTAAILAGLDSQREQDTVCDTSRTMKVQAEETANNVSSPARVTVEETITCAKNQLPSHMQDISEEMNTIDTINLVPSRTRDTAESNLPSRTRDTAESNLPSHVRDTAESNVPSPARDTAESNLPSRARDTTESNLPSRARDTAESNVPSRIRVASDDVNIAITIDNEDGEENTNVPVINKNLLVARNDAKKPDTPPLTRFMRKIEKDPPKFGTPYLAEMSARERLMGKGYQSCRTIERKRNKEEESQSQKENMETPKQPRVMELQGEGGSMSDGARDKLMGKGFQSWKTVERKRKQEEQCQSQKENMETLKQNRVKELQGEDGATIDKVTPSKFLNPNVRYFPKFNTEELLKSLETPEAERAERATKAKNRKDSLGDDELVDLAWSKATKMMAEMREARLQGNFPASQSPHDEHDADFEEPSTALQGVVITVGKKLTKDQSELNDLVASLGGDYRWNYDSSCTHFIFQGRQNDTAKDFKHAKSQGMRIVSPHWLYMCKEQNCKVDESLFPHTFNPNLSLSVVSTRRTPSRTPRSSRRPARTNSNTDNLPIIAIESIVIQEAESRDTGEARVNAEPLKGVVDLKSPARSSSDDDPTRVADVETCGSLEMREVLSKQLQDVMSKGKKRRKSKKLNCSGQVGTPDEPSTSRQTRRTQENVQKISSTRGSRSMTDEQSEEKNACDVTPSQPVHVSWDDPMSRLEQAKLAHKLERANSPTQEVGGMYDLDPEDAQYSECDGEGEVLVPQFGEQQQVQEKTTPKHMGSTTNKTPTPEGPSITFPTSNKSSKVTPPKPVVMEERERIVNKSPPIFIMSGMLMAERDNYGALVEQLGGRVLDTQVYDNTCTHLIINKVTRNEKFLACLAAGKWVLHKSYLEACRQEQKFVEEDFYEWGSEGTLSLVKNMESNVRLLAVAARDWRIKIQEEKQKSLECCGAFRSWRVVLNCDKSKEANYGRLLVAGGATVLNLKPPFSGKVDATHALLELHKVPLPQEDMEVLVSSGCLCLKPDYISGFLCNPSVDVTDYTPAEISALQTVMGENTKKRKASSSSVSQKRSKRR